MTTPSPRPFGRALRLALLAVVLLAAFAAIGRLVDPLTTAADRPAAAPEGR